MNERPLCSDLYGRLRRVFGRVRIANPGQSLKPSALPTLVGGKERLLTAGEYYTVCCPFCGDAFFRLWINHLWAEKPHLALCYNEGCLAVPGRLQALRLRVFGSLRRFHLAVARGEESEDGLLSAVSVPGQIAPLTSLPAGHQALTFLEWQRYFDPVYLERQFGVGYCLSVSDPRYSSLVNRVYVPVVMRGELVGWQGRLPYAATKGGPPKYYTKPGMPKRLSLYNFDAARAYRRVTVVEGVTDVWRIGADAVAIFGKKPSFAQQQLLSVCWGQTGFLVLCLDGDAPLLGTEDWLLELRAVFGDRLAVLALPPQCDPADMETGALRALLDTAFAQALAQGGLR